MTQVGTMCIVPTFHHCEQTLTKTLAVCQHLGQRHHLGGTTGARGWKTQPSWSSVPTIQSFDPVVIAIVPLKQLKKARDSKYKCGKRCQAEETDDDYNQYTRTATKQESAVGECCTTAIRTAIVGSGFIKDQSP